MLALLLVAYVSWSVLDIAGAEKLDIVCARAYVWVCVCACAYVCLVYVRV